MREDLPVRFLSAGQKRRVLLAQLIVRKAALWILDEPFTALDARAVEMLSELLAKHLEAHGLVILTSHQPMRLPNGKGDKTMSPVIAIIRRDLLLAMRRKSEVLTALFFFIIVVSLFPLGIGPESVLLRKIAPGVLWVAALLATMLGPRSPLFAPDHADGTLEQMLHRANSTRTPDCG